MGNNANPVAWSHARIWLAASGRPDRTADLEDSLGTLPDRCDNYRTWCHESIGGHHVVARRRCRLERSSKETGSPFVRGRQLSAGPLSWNGRCCLMLQS